METELVEPRKFVRSNLEDSLCSIGEQPKIDGRTAFRKVTDLYFKPKFFEKKGNIYRALGIKPFQKLVMGTIGRLFRMGVVVNTPETYFIGKSKSVKSLKKYESLARISEMVHTPITAVTGYGLVQGLAEGNYGDAAGNALGLVLNTYCIMLQRYNRARVYDVIERKEARTKSLHPLATRSGRYSH